MTLSLSLFFVVLTWNLHNALKRPVDSQMCAGPLITLDAAQYGARLHFDEAWWDQNVTCVFPIIPRWVVNIVMFLLFCAVVSVITCNHIITLVCYSHLDDQHPGYGQKPWSRTKQNKKAWSLWTLNPGIRKPGLF